MMKAGELREKLAFYRSAKTSNGSGGFDWNDALLLRTYAKVVEERSAPVVVANQENAQNQVHFEIRYRPDVPIKMDDKMVWRGNEFIVNNIKVDPLRTKIDIYVSSYIETSQREGFTPPITGGFPYIFPIILN